MSGITQAAITNAFKRWYDNQQRMEKLLFGASDRVALNSIKTKSFGGESYEMPVYYGRAAQGVSHTFAVGQGNAGAPLIGKFDPGATLSEDYGFITVSTKALGRLRGGDKASFSKFFQSQTERMNEVIESMAEKLEWQLFSDGYNVLGQIETTTTLGSTSIDLKVPEDARKFILNGYIVFASTKGGALRDSGKRLKVTNISDSGATDHITVDANLDTVAGISTGDFIFAEGDAANGGDRKGVYGFRAWAEAATPSEDFLGQDRSKHYLLQMQTDSAASTDITKALTDSMARKKNRNGGKTDLIFMNWLDWAKLVDQHESKIDYQPGKVQTASLATYMVNGPDGPVKVRPTAFLDEGSVLLLNSKTWCILHLFEQPVRINDDDGSMARRQTNASGIEIRGDGFRQLGCRRPSDNTLLTLT